MAKAKLLGMPKAAPAGRDNLRWQKQQARRRSKPMPMLYALKTIGHDGLHDKKGGRNEA